MEEITEKKAYEMGQDYILNGANKTNSHFSIFATKELLDAWIKGKNSKSKKELCSCGFPQSSGLKHEHDRSQIETTHGELCVMLHDEMDNIPKVVQEKIWDLVYRHYEP